LLFAAIIGWLVYRVSTVGWSGVVKNLPLSPWFYVFLSLKFLSLPVAETFVYSIIWRRRMYRHFSVFIRKRVYNNGVAGYSGEAFLAIWARRRLGLTDMQALVTVKDGNILSAFTANVATVAIIFWIIVDAERARAVAALPGGGALFGAALVIALFVAVGAVLFRRRLISLDGPRIAPILLIHGARHVAQLLITPAMYAAALPQTPFATWFAFVALYYVLTRIPFLPNQELVYLGGALALAGVSSMPQEQAAAMLLAEAAILQGVYLALFLATAHLSSDREMRNRIRPAAAGAGEDK